MKSYDDTLADLGKMKGIGWSVRSDGKFKNNERFRNALSDAVRAIERAERMAEAQRDEPSEGRDYQ